MSRVSSLLRHISSFMRLWSPYFSMCLSNFDLLKHFLSITQIFFKVLNFLIFQQKYLFQLLQNCGHPKNVIFKTLWSSWLNVKTLQTLLMILSKDMDNAQKCNLSSAGTHNNSAKNPLKSVGFTIVKSIVCSFTLTSKPSAKNTPSK